MSAPKYNLPKDVTNPLMFIPIAFVSVAIVGWVFGSALLHGLEEGKKPTGIKIVSEAKKPINVQSFAQATPELIAEGKVLFGLNCQSCHGAEGLGNGASGKGLNPAPRNFHQPTETWKNGASVSGMWTTLQNGIAGGSMASYAAMAPDDRMKIIHYVRQWVPDAPEVSQADIDALPGPTIAATGPINFEELGTDAPELELVEVALKNNMRVEAPVVEAALPEALKPLKGASLYDANCASCHGSAGGGVNSRLILTSAPYVRVSTAPLIGSTAPWVSDLGVFKSIIVENKQGTTKYHGFATFTKTDVQHLHEFVGALVKTVPSTPAPTKSGVDS